MIFDNDDFDNASDEEYLPDPDDEGDDGEEDNVEVNSEHASDSEVEMNEDEEELNVLEESNDEDDEPSTSNQRKRKRTSAAKCKPKLKLTTDASQYVAKSGRTWKADAPNANVRTPSANILRRRSGVTQRAKVQTIQGSFELFITPEICDIIIRETNRHAESVYEERRATRDDDDEESRVWKPLDVSEFWHSLVSCFTQVKTNLPKNHVMHCGQSMENPSTGRSCH